MTSFPEENPVASAVSNLLVVILILAAGSMDATWFLLLGHVFGSVMTGNLVLLACRPGTADSSLAMAAGFALGGNACGAALGDRGAAGLPESDRRPERGLAIRVLTIEAGALAVFLVIVATGLNSIPEQRGALSLGACAMGLQSATVRHLGVPGLSSTYMMGTLTKSLMLLGRRRASHIDVWAFIRLAGTVVGATVASLVIAQWPRFVGVLPVSAVIVVLIWAYRTRGDVLLHVRPPQ